MDVLYFLQRRLRFTSNLYDQAGAPFRETIRKIEAGEPPFVDTRDPEYDDVSEPYFLEECEEAAESIEVIGHWCLCMVYASLKAYLDRFINSIVRNFRNGSQLQQLLAGKKAKSWFERYRLLFVEDLGIDWHKGPVKLSELEHLNLARDDVTHNVDVTSMYVRQTERHAKRYPKGLFVDEVWLNLNLGGRIKVGRDELTAGLRMVDAFCAWLEDIRIHYPAYIKTTEAPNEGIVSLCSKSSQMRSDRSYPALRRPPAIIIPAPPRIKTALMTGETCSLCRTCTPMWTSPAFSPSVSLLGIDTKGDTIPRTNRTNPSQNRAFIDTSIQAGPSIVTTTLPGDS